MTQPFDPLNTPLTSEGQRALAASLNLAPEPVDVGEVIEAVKAVGEVLDGRPTTSALPALLLAWFLGALHDEDPLMNPEDIAWFMNEGGFMLTAMLASRRATIGIDKDKVN